MKDPKNEEISNHSGFKIHLHFNACRNNNVKVPHITYMKKALFFLLDKGSAISSIVVRSSKDIDHIQVVLQIEH